MPIVSGDIDYHLSGGASNSDPAAALGGARSSTQITSASLHNLFDIVSSAEASSGDVEYRCFYVRNAHPTLTLQNAVIWVSTDNSGADADIAISVDTVAGINGTAGTIANEGTAPSGQSFSTPTTEGTALTIGNLPAEQHQAIWVRRTVSASAAAATGSSVVITVKGDTAE